MSLVPGQRLGVHQVVAHLGAGGMGEVYLAKDTRLGRDVALKVLPEGLAEDPERLARFEREARLLASLNHSNIAHVYGFETAALDDGTAVHIIAMELVEGEDLEERLKRGAIAPDDAVAIAKQIAEALEEAHEKGIVHRDLKPANVKVAPDGRVKVLDFGLAKAWSGDESSGAAADVSKSPTLAHTGTEAGIILGTAAYMSPEQARGKPVDKRADIWAFGAVLFEMLSGQRLFEGETVTDVLAAVVKEPIRWDALPASTPAFLRHLLLRCLDRNPRSRLRDVGEARVALEGAAAGDAPGVAAARPKSRRWVLAASFVAGVVLTAAGARLLVGRKAEDPLPRRFALAEVHLTIDALQGLALSPDGRRLVFRGRGDDGIHRLYVRPLESPEVQALPGTEEGRLPFFAPAGDSLGFFTQDTLKKVALSGGSSFPLARVASATGGTWLPDGTIVFASETKGLERIPAAGGSPAAVMPAGGANTPLLVAPWALPGGKALLLGVRRGDSFDVAVLPLANPKLLVIAPDAFGPIYARTGHVIFQQGQGGSTLLALPFDAERLVATGAAFPVLSEIGTRASFQARAFTLAEDGTLAYIPMYERGALFWVDRSGGASPPSVEIDRLIDTPRVSPDGRFVAFRTPAPNCDVWVHDLERGATTRITLEGDNHGVVWSPDGRRVAFARAKDAGWTLLTGAADGSGSTEPITAPPLFRPWPSSFSPDGRLLLIESRRSDTGDDIDLLSLADRTLIPLVHSSFDERGAVFSPDGRSIAFVSNESGRDEIYLQGYPGLDSRQQISTSGGSEPGWSRSGRELFFRQGRNMMVVDVTGGPARQASRPRLLFEGDFAEGPAGQRGYDISPDTKRFLMARVRTRGGGGVNVVLNWFGEIRRRALAAKQ